MSESIFNGMGEPSRPYLGIRSIYFLFKLWNRNHLSETRCFKLFQLYIGYRLQDYMDKEGRYPKCFFTLIKRELGYKTTDQLIDDVRRSQSFLLMGNDPHCPDFICTPIWYAEITNSGIFDAIFPSKSCGNSYNIYNNTLPGGTSYELPLSGGKPSDVKHDADDRRKVVQAYFRWMLAQSDSKYLELVQLMNDQIRRHVELRHAANLKFPTTDEEIALARDVDAEGRYPKCYFTLIKRELGYKTTDQLIDDIRRSQSFLLMGNDPHCPDFICTPFCYAKMSIPPVLSQKMGLKSFANNNNNNNYPTGSYSNELPLLGGDATAVEHDAAAKRATVQAYFDWFFAQSDSKYLELARKMNDQIRRHVELRHAANPKFPTTDEEIALARDVDAEGRHPKCYFTLIKRELGYKTTDQLIDDVRRSQSFVLMGNDPHCPDFICTPIWYAEITNPGVSDAFFASKSCGNSYNIYNNTPPGGASYELPLSGGSPSDVKHDADDRRKVVQAYFRWMLADEWDLEGSDGLEDK